MPHDAVDPGTRGDYPYWPRDADGNPRPIGDVRVRRRPFPSAFAEDVEVIDTRPRDTAGEPIAPPRIVP